LEAESAAAEQDFWEISPRLLLPGPPAKAGLLRNRRPYRPFPGWRTSDQQTLK